MKFLLQSPADTTIYMIAGYGFILIAMCIYLVSLMVRWRKSMQDLRSLQEMKKRNH